MVHVCDIENKLTVFLENVLPGSTKRVYRKGIKTNQKSAVDFLLEKNTYFPLKPVFVAKNAFLPNEEALSSK